MPLITPLRSDLNFTPISTEEGSPSSGVVGVVDDGQIVHAAQLKDAGVTGFDGAEAGPVPIALVAVTVKV